MKLIKKISITILLLAVISIFVVGCSGSQTVKVPINSEVTYENIFSESNVLLSVGESKQLTYSAVDVKDWTSSDKTVVSVDENGLVTGLTTGSALITVTSNNKKYSTVVRVKDANVTVSLTLDKTVTFGIVGSEISIEAKLSCQGVDLSKIELDWEIEDNSIAEIVYSSVNSADILFKNEGKTFLNVSYGEYVSAKCELNVSKESEVIQTVNLTETGMNIPSEYNDLTTATESKLTRAVISNNYSVDIMEEYISYGGIDYSINASNKMNVLAFGQCKGFSDFEIDSSTERRFAYGIYVKELAMSKSEVSSVKEYKFYSKQVANEQGKFAVLVKDLNKRLYSVQSFVEFISDNEIKTYVSDFNDITFFGETSSYSGKTSLSAVENASDIKYYSSSMDDNGKFIGKYGYVEIVSAVENESWYTMTTTQTSVDAGNTWPYDKVGIMFGKTVEELAKYKKLSDIDTLKLTFKTDFRRSATEPIGQIRVLSSFDNNNVPTYTIIPLSKTANVEYTLTWDLDLIIENYYLLEDYSLFYIQSGRKITDIYSTSLKDVAFIKNPYVGLTELCPVKNASDIVYYTTTDNDNGKINGKYPNTESVSATENSGVYTLSTTKIVDWPWNKLGITFGYTKEELINYKKHSGLNTLSLTFQVGLKSGNLYVLTGFNSGVGEYTTQTFLGNTDYTLTWDIDFIIDNYDSFSEYTLFYVQETVKKQNVNHSMILKDVVFCNKE